MYGIVAGESSIHGHIQCINSVLANPIYMRCMYGNFGRKITKYTVYIHGPGQPFTQILSCHNDNDNKWRQFVSLDDKADVAKCAGSIH